MLPKKNAAHPIVPPQVAALVRAVSERLSRMEALLFEMRHEQDVQLRRLRQLRAQLDGHASKRSTPSCLIDTFHNGTIIHDVDALRAAVTGPPSPNRATPRRFAARGEAPAPSERE